MGSALLDDLLAAGGRLWEGGPHRRVYFDEETLQTWAGLWIHRYGTGNISQATQDGEHISNAQARRILASINGAYYDLNAHCVRWPGGRPSEHRARIEEAVKRYLADKVEF